MNFEALDNFSASDIIDFKTIDIYKITFSSPTRVKGEVICLYQHIKVKKYIFKHLDY